MITSDMPVTRRLASNTSSTMMVAIMTPLNGRYQFADQVRIADGDVEAGCEAQDREHHVDPGRGSPWCP